MCRCTLPFSARRVKRQYSFTHVCKCSCAARSGALQSVVGASRADNSLSSVEVAPQKRIAARYTQYIFGGAVPRAWRWSTAALPRPFSPASREPTVQSASAAASRAARQHRAASWPCWRTCSDTSGGSDSPALRLRSRSALRALKRLTCRRRPARALLSGQRKLEQGGGSENADGEHAPPFYDASTPCSPRASRGTWRSQSPSRRTP